MQLYEALWGCILPHHYILFHAVFWQISMLDTSVLDIEYLWNILPTNHKLRMVDCNTKSQKTAPTKYYLLKEVNDTHLYKTPAYFYPEIIFLSWKRLLRISMSSFIHLASSLWQYTLYRISESNMELIWMCYPVIKLDIVPTFTARRNVDSDSHSSIELALFWNFSDILILQMPCRYLI